MVGGMNYLDRLSPRQRQVFDLLLHGLTDKEIAAQFGISVHTVNSHVKVCAEVADISHSSSSRRWVGFAFAYGYALGQAAREAAA